MLLPLPEGWGLNEMLRTLARLCRRRAQPFTPALSLRERECKIYKYLRGSVMRPSMALATTVAGLARKIWALAEPMRPL
jgi:hypothetical protein